jgi:hypothetical protein
MCIVSLVGSLLEMLGGCGGFGYLVVTGRSVPVVAEVIMIQVVFGSLFAFLQFLVSSGALIRPSAGAVRGLIAISRVKVFVGLAILGIAVGLHIRDLQFHAPFSTATAFLYLYLLIVITAPTLVLILKGRSDVRRWIGVNE